MYKLSNRSLKNLRTCHPDLQLLFQSAIRITPVDFAVTQGYRPPTQQFELYKQGREFINNKWLVVDKKNIVTNIDGLDKEGSHNKNPSNAVDIVAYNKNIMTYKDRPYYIIYGIIYHIAKTLNIKISWGGHWKSLKDLCHYELIK